MKHKWIKYDRASSDTEPAVHGWICTECLSWRHDSTFYPEPVPPPEVGCRANDMEFEGGVRPSWSTSSAGGSIECPSRVQVFGLDYTVEIAEWGDDTLGRFNSGLARIELRANLPPNVKASTLLHELLHVVDTALQLGLSEKVICRLETGLMALLCDNRDTLVPFLIHQPTGE